MHGKIPTLKISLIQIFRAHLWQKIHESLVSLGIGVFGCTAVGSAEAVWAGQVAEPSLALLTHLITFTLLAHPFIYHL